MADQHRGARLGCRSFRPHVDAGPVVSTPCLAAERAVALAPNIADAQTGLGNIREFQGRSEDAVAHYTRAYRLDPQFDMSLHFMGRALLALQRYDEAEIAFKRRLMFSPRSDMIKL